MSRAKTPDRAILLSPNAMPPIRFGALALSEGRLDISGKPDFDDFARALACADYLEDNAPLWKADLFAYAETRLDWKDRIDALIDAGTYTEATVKQYRYVSTNVAPDRRLPGLSFSHHAEVASLPASEQVEWLTTAKTEHLSASELRRKIRRAKRVTILSGQASAYQEIYSKIADAAYAASDACKAIVQQDAAHAEEQIRVAREQLMTCAEHVQTLRGMNGKQQ